MTNAPPIVKGKRRRIGRSPDGRKICPNCRTPKDPDGFYGKGVYCKQCIPSLQQHWRQQKPEEFGVYANCSYS